jgi:ketosteroid isomerase-like protein
MTDEDEVLAANAAFYAAFASSDAEAMDAIWALRAPVACVHPGWSALVGRDRVMDSWRRILRGGSSPITCGGAVAHLLGEAAFVTCLERLPGATLIASNFFVREDGRFRMVHHHAGPAARPEEAPAPPRGTLN